MVNINLNRKYDEINRLGKEQLRTIGIIPANFDLINDPRRSLDINYVLPTSCKETIEEKLTKPLREICKKTGTSQVIFPTSWLHMTLFTPFSAGAEQPQGLFEGIEQGQIPLQVVPYLSCFKKVVSSARKFEIVFNRIVVTAGSPTKPGCIFLGGTPKDTSVQDTREAFQRIFETNNLVHTQKHLPDIFHITLLRWQNAESPKQSEEIIRFLESVDGKDIWRGDIDEVSFVSGGYVMTDEKTVNFDTVKLHS